jgi:micrococcal nuclease
VVDGDTIVVRGGHHIRLIGVDTPETKDPRRPVQCFGPQAAAFLESLVPRGAAVRLVGDTEARDVYDRTLAYAYRLPDGLFVNAELVRQGYAQVLTIPPNVAHTDELVALAAEARNQSRGLWSACSP